MYPTRQHSGARQLENDSPERRRARLFAQAILGNPVDESSYASNQSQHARDTLEFAASISDRALGRLRRIQAVEVQTARERELLEWLASISDRHHHLLLEIQLGEAQGRPTGEDTQRPGELLNMQETQWDPSKHPRRGSAPNAGWFATTQGASSAASSTRPSDATTVARNAGDTTSSEPADITTTRFDQRNASQEPASTERKKLHVAPAIHTGPKQVEVQQVAVGGGHHWVPQTVLAT